MHLCAPPLYAVQRLASGRWLIWAPSDDPCDAPPRIVAVVDEPRNVMHASRPFNQPKPRPRPVQIVSRRELEQIADLVGRLDVRDVERFCLQRACLVRELQKLARRAA